MIAAIALYVFVAMPTLNLDCFFEDGSMNIQIEPSSIIWFETCTTDTECESLFE